MKRTDDSTREEIREAFAEGRQLTLLGTSQAEYERLTYLTRKAFFALAASLPILGRYAKPDQ
jgi:hypothetical protein